jgi:hypothetical protein
MAMEWPVFEGATLIVEGTVQRRVFLLTLALAIAPCTASAQQSTEPVYGWLAFGPKEAVRVLVCLDGKTITLEQRAGDKPVGRKRRFERLSDCKDVTFADPDGKTSYVIKAVEQLGLVPELGKALELGVEVRGPLAYHQGAVVQLARGPERAPVAHFHAPLTMSLNEKLSHNLFRTLVWKRPADVVLRKGPAPSELFVTIRNRKLHSGCYVVVGTTDESGKKCLFPKAVRPVAEIEFPPAKPGGPVIRKRYTLDHFC